MTDGEIEFPTHIALACNAVRDKNQTTSFQDNRYNIIVPK